MNKAKTISLLKLVPVLATALSAQGCVGIVLEDMHTKTFEPVRVVQKPGLYAASRASTDSESLPNDNPTTSFLKAYWGQPSHLDLVTTPASGELWTYNFDRKSCGVITWLIVPIPLLLPVGREHVVFYIRDGRVVKADQTSQGVYEAFAGFGPDGPDARCGWDH